MQLIDAWTHLNHGLTVFESVWRPQPFRLAVASSSSPSWQHPLHQKAADLDDATFRDINSSNEVLRDWVTDCLSDLATDNNDDTYDENGNTYQLQSEAFQSMLDVLQEFPTPNTSQQANEKTTYSGRTQPREANGIPGRKWEQVEAFTKLVPKGNNNQYPIIDWCSGKGHLARWMHHSSNANESSCGCGCRGRPVHCLEIDSKLCRAGERLTKKQTTIPTNTGVMFYEHDVLNDALPSTLQGENFTYTALHACGELHRTALRVAVQNRVRDVVIAPCCYEKHFGRHDTADNDNDGLLFQPLSTVVKDRTSLSIHREDLFLAVADGIVTSNAKEANVREKEQAWRLAFELWRRDQEVSHSQSSSEQHLSVPSAPYRILADDNFPLFVHHCITSKGRNSVERSSLQPAFTAALLNNAKKSSTTRLADNHHHLDEYAVKGEALQRLVERQELIRRAFQRSFELWLTMDCGLFLEESGYTVELQQLCDRSITPRNVVIVAHHL